ncbi:MAG: omptin family outer membrane protease [Hyphomicrobiales bacterium]
MSAYRRSLFAAALLLLPAPLAAQEAQNQLFEDFQLRTTIGMRYWYSQSNFLVELEQFDRTDVSRLEFGDVNQHSAEVFFRVDDFATNSFLKGTLGIGRTNSGFLDDEDYFTNGQKFSDTYSALDARTIGHMTIDAGWRFANSPAARTRAGIFGGYQYISDSYMARGVTCNADEFNGAFCGAPGETVVSYDTKVIRNTVYWHVMRVGIETEIELTKKLSLAAETAAVPFIYFENEDSHYLRTGLGPIPNFEDKGTQGYGVEAEAFLNYAVTDNITVGLGGRYWWLKTKDTLAISAAQRRMYSGAGYSANTLERYGLAGQISYSF